MYKLKLLFNEIPRRKKNLLKDVFQNRLVQTEKKKSFLT